MEVEKSPVRESGTSPSKKEKVKHCAVCGDKALGYNFGALTCESCKAFFRRNAIKNKDFKCPFNNECEITMVTRRFCQKCRLQKCFVIGMKKEYILSEEEKELKRRKVNENRAKKRANSEAMINFGGTEQSDDNSLLNSSVLSPSPGSCHQTSSRPETPSGGLRPQARVLPSTRGDMMPKVKSRRLQTSPNADQSHSSPATPHALTQSPTSGSLIKQELLLAVSPPRKLSPESLEQLKANHQSFGERGLQSNSCGTVSNGPYRSDFQNNYRQQSQLAIPDFSQSNSLDEIIAVAIEAEFHVNSIDFVPGRENQGFNSQEQARMDELFVASRSLVEPLELEKTDEAEPSNLISVINLTDLAIKRIIKMAKNISPFSNLCQEDQIALLKGGCTELMILRSVINYNPDKNSWRLPSKDHPRELSLELLKEANQLGVNLYEEHQRFVQSFDPKWRTDENVMLLLSAIALFSPNRVNVTHKDVIKMEQDIYYFLLRRYLETVCNSCEPRRAYLHLIGRLQDLHRLNESHIQVFLEVNPKQVAPLLIEIFDLCPK